MSTTQITPAMARRIELWPVDKLRPYDRNARTHSQEQIAQIAASIVQFGFVNPILVDSSAGIVAGHGRLLAARKLGLAEVPVVVLDHLSETQRRAYIIADNKLTLNGGWDPPLLLTTITVENTMPTLSSWQPPQPAQVVAARSRTDRGKYFVPYLCLVTEESDWYVLVSI